MPLLASSNATQEIGIEQGLLNQVMKHDRQLLWWNQIKVKEPKVSDRN